MYPSPAWQQDNVRNAHPPTSGNIDLRDRVKAYLNLDDDMAQQKPRETEVSSPTDAFFGRPSRLANQTNTRQAPATRALNHRQPQQELKKSDKPQQKPLSLNDLQTSGSSLAQQMIEHIITEGNTLYDDAVRSLNHLHEAMKQALDETSAEDHRLLTILDTSHQKVAKPLSETRISNSLLREEIHIGKHVASFKESIDNTEAEVASLWDQWRVAQKVVDDIVAELADERGGETGSVSAVRDSLARELGKLEEELSRVLEDAHEEARVSEKNFSKKIKGVKSAILQQYFLE